MTPRWNWDFEDEQRARARNRPGGATNGGRTASGSGSGPGGGAGGPSDRRAQIRRRRLGAGIAIGLLLLVALIAIVSGSSHHDSAAMAAARRELKGAQHAKPHPSSKPENDLNSAVAHVLTYTPFVKEGSTGAPDVALTFDDGPGPYTPQVLSVLEHYHVHATFFVVGKMLRYFSASTVREIEDGDVIADHTQSHPMLAQLSAHDQKEELFEAIARIELLGAPRPVLFRPPYGSFNATTLRELHALHLLMVLWSVDTNDFAQPGVSTIVERALEGAKPGGIILMHDAGGTRTETIEALPAIIKGIRARGLRLVTVPRLLMEDPPPAGQQLPTNLSGG
jgi:peptidoglycan/xylan/chitin deacetylase (PgdA/CDA1 family)